MKNKSLSKKDMHSKNIDVQSELAEPHLTNRETEILKLLAMGYNNPQIGDKLFISRRTVEQHRKNIIKKVQATNFVDLILYAQKMNLI